MFVSVSTGQLWNCDGKKPVCFVWQRQTHYRRFLLWRCGPNRRKTLVAVEQSKCHYWCWCRKSESNLLHSSKVVVLLNLPEFRLYKQTSGKWGTDHFFSG